MPPEENQQHQEQSQARQDHKSVTNQDRPASCSSLSSRGDGAHSAAISCSISELDPDIGRPEAARSQQEHRRHQQRNPSASPQSSLELDSTDQAELTDPCDVAPQGVRRETARNQWSDADNNNNNNCAPAVANINHMGDSLAATTITNRHAGVYSVNSTNTQLTGDELSSSYTTLDKPGLLFCNREPLKLKDFRAEVRAPLDVEQFCHQAELLLDLSETSMSGIIEAMLAKVATNEQISPDRLDEMREAIFIPGSAALMARTIHGFYSLTDPLDSRHTTAAGLSHDQTWLCALCNLSQVSRRHMVFARFKQPINMGESAREVRLFVLVAVPTKEKSTKGQLETGRTFATMLTDADFRQKLLHARDPVEFKALMMVKAQQMARANRLRNRHKYRLDPILNESISSVSLEELRLGLRTTSHLVGACGDRMNEESVFKCVGLAGRPAVAVGETARLQSAQDGLKARLTFNKNPRTSKLFELITESSAGGAKTCSSTKLNTPGLPRPEPFAFIESGGKLGAAPISGSNPPKTDRGGIGRFHFGRGALDDFKRRIKCYTSDFRDALVGPPRTVQKTVATIWFLYFAILLPTIAFSSLNTVQTHGHMGDLRKAIIGQAIGGLGFALLGGQPLVIIMTTAPLCLYTKVIHQMCLDYGFPFPAMYAAVGLWNGLFLVIYSLFGFSELMKWCTRSTEEIFALFIVVAFITDAGKDLMKNFRRFYFAPACEALNSRTSNMMTMANQTMHGPAPAYLFNGTSSHRAFRDIEEEIESSVCRRETSLLFVLLMLGTLWLAVTLYKFRRTPYLSATKRDALADYALPTAVILMSLVGSTIFDNIYVEKFPPLVDLHFEQARIDLLPWTGVLTSMGLGFTLSLLFFMDQNISAAMVMAPQNRLKKGSAYHYDLLIVGLLNGALSLYGLPMMHGVLPHSPLHARSLADIEERIEQGHLREVVVNARETRVTSIVAHILVLLSLFLIPYPIAYIPRAVLNGLFLYMAVTSLDGLQVFERILLLVTEQNKYPPNHYIRRCPQRKIHQFTLLQLGQLAIMCLFGFSPITIVEMFFPVFILLMIPFRHKFIPKYIETKYLEALDGKH